jgi:hypothetical protein
MRMAVKTLIIVLAQRIVRNDQAIARVPTPPSLSALIEGFSKSDPPPRSSSFAGDEKKAVRRNGYMVSLVAMPSNWSMLRASAVISAARKGKTSKIICSIYCCSPPRTVCGRRRIPICFSCALKMPHWQTP